MKNTPEYLSSSTHHQSCFKNHIKFFKNFKKKNFLKNFQKIILKKIQFFFEIIFENFFISNFFPNVLIFSKMKVKIPVWRKMAKCRILLNKCEFETAVIDTFTMILLKLILFIFYKLYDIICIMIPSGLRLRCVSKSSV